MAVPSSGELKLWDDIWNNEIGGTQGENSLHSASVYAGFSTPDAMSDFYGWSDIELPSVTTTNITATCHVRVCACGNITNDGNSDSLTRGFYIGTSANPYASNTKYTVGGTQSGTGEFKYDLTGRTQNTRYYAWAWAANEAGEVVGGRDCVTTPYPPFTPTTNTLSRGCSTTCQGSCYTALSLAQYGYINPYSSAFAVQYQCAVPSGGLDPSCSVYCTANGNAQNRRRVCQGCTFPDYRVSSTLFSCQGRGHVPGGHCMYNMVKCAGCYIYNSSGRFIIQTYGAYGGGGCSESDGRFCTVSC